jgi:iron complex transport system permease protein
MGRRQATRDAGATVSGGAAGPSVGAWIIPALVVAVVVAALIGLATGAYPLTLYGAMQSLQKLLTGAPMVTPEDRILLLIRGPRVLVGIMAGAALAGAGVVYQGLFRNPLVSPDVLGVSAGAGLGAVIGIFLSVPLVAIQGFAFVGGLATVALVYAIATVVQGRDPTLVLVLGGVVVGALAGAAISLLKILADPYDQLPAITFWLLGSLASTRASDVWGTLPAIVLGLVPLVLLRWRINVLSLGDEEARSLGVEAGRIRAVLIAAATLMTASVVAITGVIGWVGLVIPHMARMLVGPNFERLLPSAMLMGAAYLVLVDTLARSIGRIEVPIGILTAVVGAPFFIWLLWRGRHGWS